MDKFLPADKLFLLFLALVFAAYFSAVFLPIEDLLSHFVIDDSFYYFKIASNLANGMGPTFDGEHFTNGYHPLWMWILTVIYFFIPADKILAVKVVVGLSVVLYFLTGLLMWGIVSFLVRDRLLRYALVSAYVLNPWNLTFYLNGLETPLSLFFFCWFAYVLIGIFSGRDSRRNFILLGTAGGLLILSRLDYGLFVAFAGLALIWKRGLDWDAILSFGLPAALLAGPWFIYNKIQFGSFFPTSGLAYTLINHRLFFYKIRTFTEVILWSAYNFGGSLAFSLKTIGLPVPYYAIEVWVKSAIWMSALIGLLVSPIIYLWKQGNYVFFRSASWLVFLILSAGFLSQVFVHGAVRWSGRPWYFSVFPVIGSLFVALLLGDDSSFLNKRRIVSVYLVLCLISYGFYATRIFSEQANQVDMYRTALWAGQNLPADARIASFNSGIMGYFSDRFVLNSDGLVNQPAYEAMKENRLWKFFEDLKMNYFIDYEIALTYRYKSFLGIDDPLDRLEKIFVPGSAYGGNYAGSNLGVYSLK